MAAEQEVFGVITSGAESDLEHVTRVARSMVGRWGMSDRIGPLSVLPLEGDPRMAGVSETLLNAVDDEVRRITEECYADARRLVREHRAQLDAIVPSCWRTRASTKPRSRTASCANPRTLSGERPRAVLPLGVTPAAAAPDRRAGRS
jgi:ATP-dependent Zn protease